MKHLSFTILLTFLFVKAFSQKINSGQLKSALSQKYLTVKIKMSDATRSDTLQMNVCTILANIQDHITKTPTKNGWFIFKIPVKATYGYFSLDRKIARIGTEVDMAGVTDFFYWTAGDNIQIDLTKIGGYDRQHTTYQTSISGYGAEKYQLALKADSVYKNVVSNQSTYGENFKEENAYHVDSAIKFLNLNAKHLSKIDIDVLKANILFRSGGRNFRVVAYSYKDSLVKNKNLSISNYVKNLSDFEKNYFRRVSSVGLARSLYFPMYAYREAAVEYLIEHPEKIIPHSYWMRPVTIDNILPIVRKNYSGEVRDVIIANLLFSDVSMLDAQKTTASALVAITTPKIKQQLESILHSHNTGTPAYNFNLPDTTGKYYSLQSLKGKVVYQDFYFYGCGGCTWLYKNVLNDVEEYYKNNQNVVFVSVCCDANMNRVKEGIRNGNYNSSLSLNLYTEGKGYSHDIIKFYNVVAYPTVLLIDKSGRIARFDTGDIKTKDGLIKQINRLLKD